MLGQPSFVVLFVAFLLASGVFGCMEILRSSDMAALAYKANGPETIQMTRKESTHADKIIDATQLEDEDDHYS